MTVFLIALIAGLSGMFGWGISDFFAKKSTDKIGNLKTVIGTQFIEGIFLFLYYLTRNNSLPVITPILIVYLTGLAFIDGIVYLLLYRSFEKGILSIVSPIAASAAGVAVLVSVFLYKEVLSKTGLIGVILIFLGIIATSTDIRDLKKSFSKANLVNGAPEALGVMVLMGLWFPMWDKFVQDKDWLFWLILLKLVMEMMLLIYFYITRKGDRLLAGYKSVFIILLPAAILDALAYMGTTWGYSITTNTTSLITVIANAYSLPTIILAYFLLKERISKQQALGIISIISGIIISSF